MPTFERWSTGVTAIAPGEIAPRGRDIADLIVTASWTEAMWLVLFGDAPTGEQEDALRRALVAAVDHGVAAPSTASARVVASTRVAPSIALAVGLTAFAGPAHGGAASETARVLSAIVESGGAVDEAAEAAVQRAVGRRERVPGYGHPYHAVDPRVAPLMAGIAADRRHRGAAEAVERVLLRAVSPKLRMNADAAVAALLLDAGAGPDDVNLVTSLGRAVGIAAHVREEMANEKPFRAPALDTVDFVAPGSVER